MTLSAEEGNKQAVRLKMRKIEKCEGKKNITA